jgi:hypothetical protein
MNSQFKIIAALSISLATGNGTQAQSPVWNQSSQWTIYNVRGAKFYKIGVDSLSAFNRQPLNDDSMRMFLAQASALPSDKAPMWMGAFVTSCTIDHKMRKIDISSYGGFLFDEAEKKYYTVADDVQKDWLNYLAACAGSVPTQK